MPRSGFVSHVDLQASSELDVPVPGRRIVLGGKPTLGVVSREARKTGLNLRHSILPASATRDPRIETNQRRKVRERLAGLRASAERRVRPVNQDLSVCLREEHEVKPLSLASGSRADTRRHLNAVTTNRTHATNAERRRTVSRHRYRNLLRHKRAAVKPPEQELNRPRDSGVNNTRGDVRQTNRSAVNLRPDLSSTRSRSRPLKRVRARERPGRRSRHARSVSDQSPGTHARLKVRISKSQ